MIYRPHCPANLCGLLGAVLLCVSALQAQQSSSQRELAVASQQASLTARAQFAAGNIPQAESTLLALNQAKAGTAEWHLESAQRLAGIAFSFRQTGAVPLSISVAQRALDQLSSAEAKALPDRILGAQVKYLIGKINERLVGTTTVARANYRAAVDLDPQLKKAAESLAKLDRAAEAVAARQQKKPGNG